MIFLIQIPPNIFRLIWNGTISWGFIRNFLAELNRSRTLLIKIHWTCLHQLVFIVVVDFDHVTLYFVLLWIDNWFHALKDIFVVKILWGWEAVWDGLNYKKITSRIPLRVMLQEKDGRATDGKSDWMWERACWWERFLGFWNILSVNFNFNFILKFNFIALNTPFHF